MKVKQIVSEHKKGVRAMKYAKKTKGTVPVYGPEVKDAKLKPVKPTGPLGETVEVKPMPGASQVSVDGKPIATTDAATAQVISQAAEKGQFSPTDGSTPPTTEGGDEEVIGGDPTDQFINDVETEEGFFDDPTNPQIEALKAMLADPKYASNPAWKAQLEKRLKIAIDRASLDQGQAMGADGNPKPVLAPDQFSKANPNFKETQSAIQEADTALLNKMLTIAGLR